MSTETIQNYIRNLSYNTTTLPEEHKQYIVDLGTKYYPKVIYDIGSCVLEWSRFAETIWPEASIYVFDATDTLRSLYDENKYEYHIGVLSDVDGKEVDFYQNGTSPYGNSYYRENSKYSGAATVNYPDSSKRRVKTQTVDRVVEMRGFPLPDLVKIDVQGCEIDILIGMKNTLKQCKHIIIELQRVEYNIGANLHTYSVPFIESLGFKLVTPLFCNNGPDGDYHFTKL